MAILNGNCGCTETEENILLSTLQQLEDRVQSLELMLQKGSTTFTNAASVDSNLAPGSLFMHNGVLKFKGVDGKISTVTLAEV